MQIETLVKQFWQNGFLLLEKLFDPDLMDKYNTLILGHFGLDPEYLHDPDFVTRSGAEVIPWFPQQDGIKIFDRIQQHKALNLLTEQILGPKWRSLDCMVMFSKQGTAGQAWHQDCPPENPQIFNLNRLVYTHDITQETGGQIVVVKGSHKLGLLPASEYDQSFENEICLSPNKGDVLLLHGHLWHRVKPVTGAYRVSTNYRSIPAGTPDNVTDICVYRNMLYRFSSSEVILDRLNP
ncbi:MAG: phytanoyl-CoA dioxygenase [Gammaproteobacteria bacterium]|nr:phytanoyl-CoA dioxygenase family protein [Gammaproteobacteria bacterium]NNC97584.1 phytanoyl-CoA dioxygenase [Gammaproteobacteria bacterium]NNM14799.1 phytanoyl-CoA dioxygenase [Gammaproteobacteria bacterium]